MGARLSPDPEVREGLATLVAAQQLLSLLVDAGTGVSTAPEPSTSAGVRSAADRLVEDANALYGHRRDLSMRG
jgi:hypothetical protein